jgi:SAM-dependent methyltransferase
MKVETMAIEDQIRWNKKYKETPKLLEKRDVGIKLKEALTYSKVGCALDVACGAGKNSIYLAKNGFKVDSYDISQIALDALNEKNHKNITTFCKDLDGFEPTQSKYDFIVMTNFLDRELIPKLAKGLKIDGVLFIETYMHHESNEKKSSNTSYLLKEGELKTFFTDEFTVLDYSEFDNGKDELYKMRKQSIIIQKL